jgi:hypothetical protein
LSTGLGALVDICIAPGCAPGEASKKPLAPAPQIRSEGRMDLQTNYANN